MLRGLLSWLGQVSHLSSKADFTRLREAISINVSGPDFFDFYPTVDSIADRLRASNQFRDDAVGWMTTAAYETILSGRHISGIVDQIVRTGVLLTPEAVVALGFPRSMKLGDRYARAIAGNDAPAATARLQTDLHLAIAQAKLLHDLRRMSELDVQEVIFSSARDERCTPMEVRLEGSTLTIDEARKLAREQIEAMPRSTFRAVIEF